MMFEKRGSHASAIAAGGLLLVVAGVVGYFVAVVNLGGRLPWFRNTAIPNWTVIAAGIALTVLAVRREPRRWLPKALLGMDVVLAGLFAALLYVATLVPVTSGPAVGTSAPDFTLRDQHGDSVRLTALRGAPVLLVFYRGHW